MKNVRSLLYSFAAVFLSLVPLLVSAQGVLVPRSSDASGRTDYMFYNLCTFGELIQNIINFAIVLAVPMVAILVGYAGFLYFTSGANPGNIAKARQIFGTACIGFLVAISGWLIVNTVLHALMGGNGYFQNNSWFTIQCQGGRVGVDKPVSISDWLSSASAPTGGLTADQAFLPPGAEPASLDPTSGASPSSSMCNSGYTYTENASEYWCQSNTNPNDWQETNRYMVGEDYNVPYGTATKGTEQWASQLAEACATSGLQDCTLARAIMATESGGNCNAVSPAGAIGCMQVLPTTACSMDPSIAGCGSCTTRIDNTNGNCASVAQALLNPNLNMSLGTQYLSQLSQQFGGNQNLIAAAYNGGPVANRLSVESSCSGMTVWQCQLNPGYQETRNYVPRVNTYYRSFL